jgi:hypothetical protein
LKLPTFCKKDLTWILRSKEIAYKDGSSIERLLEISDTIIKFECKLLLMVSSRRKNKNEDEG